MSLSADSLLDRINLKKQVVRWRTLAILLAILLLVAFVFRSFGLGGVGGDYIARISVEGIIANDGYRNKILTDIEKNDHIKAVIFHINSPGGTLVGGEIMHNKLQSISKKKPVITVMGSMATSGAYMAAVATDRIIAHKGTITGSIGVILQHTEVTELAKKIGINFVNFKSGELKATPSPFEKVTPKVRRAIQSTIMDAKEIFVDMVAEGRPMLSKDKVDKLSDGSIFTGRQALKNQLIDAIGNEKTALEWLKTEKNIMDLKIRDISTAKPENGLQKLLSSFSNTVIGVTQSKGIEAVWTP
jgi:protease-4